MNLRSKYWLLFNVTHSFIAIFITLIRSITATGFRRDALRSHILPGHPHPGAYHLKNTHMENTCSPYRCIQFKYLTTTHSEHVFFFRKEQIMSIFQSWWGRVKNGSKRKKFKKSVFSHLIKEEVFVSSSNTFNPLIFLSQQKLIASSSFEKSKGENTNGAIFRNQ